MSDHLPLDVLSEIMSRLPVISILRFTSVCKSWYSLITTRNFITTHLNHKKITNQNHILIRHTTGISFHQTEHYSVYHDNINSPTFEFLESFDFPFTTTIKEHRCFLIIGISNGLICLVESVFRCLNIILWNPSMRKYVNVPNPILRFNINAHLHHALGFGYAPSTNECKIVRVVYSRDGSYWVEIYEVSTGWRNINADISHGINIQEPQAFVNGVVHWMGFELDKCGSCPVIVLFDMETEVFGLMTVPDAVPNRDSKNLLRVAKFGDSISLIRYSHNNNVRFCCIWVMKEYGVEASWSKVFTIDMRHMKLRNPIGFRANGHLLMVKNGRSLVSYDPESEQIEFLKINGCPFTFYTDKFVESLILLDEINEKFVTKK